MNILDQYKKLRKPDLLAGPITIKAHLPTPTENDYKRGYIKRYFAQKVNDMSSPIREVSDDIYINVSRNSFYVTTSLKWRISGPLTTITNVNGRIDDKGVSESNRISIQLASKKIKNLKLYLPNLLQFHK